VPENGAQIHHHAARNDAVHRHRENGFPACGDAPDPVGHCVHVVEQAAGFAQQLVPRRSRNGLPSTAVKQQHIECVFDLAYPVSQCTGHQVKGTGSSGKAAFLTNGLQHQQGFRRQPIAWSLHDCGLFIQLV
jgi:hypothetical protein